MNLEAVPMTSPSPSLQGMRMSYAAAVQTGPGVKVLISPRFKKPNKSGKGKTSKITADTKFRIFDEQPKPHIVRVDPKVFRTDVELKSRMKSLKSKKPLALKATKSQLKLATNMSETSGADIKTIELKFKKATVAAVQTARNLNSIQSNLLTASNGGEQSGQAARGGGGVQSPIFVDSVSYLSFHQERLQRMIKSQSICAIYMQSPEPMKIPQFEDKHFKNLEEAALLAQNRTMLRLWLNSDQLIC